MCLQIQKSPEKGKKMTNESHSCQRFDFFSNSKNPKSKIRWRLGALIKGFISMYVRIIMISF